MSWDQLLIAVSTMFTASVVQSAIGFGSGLVAMPVLVTCGFTPQTVMGLVLPNNLVQTSINCWQHRHRWRSESVPLMTVLRAIGLLAGLWILARFLQDPSVARQMTGITLLGALAVHGLLKIPPRQHVPIAWTVLTGLVSGILAGAVMMGGPPLVLWVLAHDWDVHRQRSFLWGQFLLLMPLQALLLLTQYGSPMATALGYGCAMMPVGWLGAQLGNVLAHQISPRWIRRIMLAVLVLIGASAALRR